MSDTYANFWTFIEENLPGYYGRNDVTMDDMLLRYVEGGDLYDGEKEEIEGDYKNKQEVIEEIIRLETKFCEEALRAYYKKMHP